MDYDSVAADYHHRYDQSPMPDVAQALDALADRLAAERILEVGCGTGRWLQALVRPDRQLTGLDPSQGMLHQARSRLSAIPFIQAAGEHLPLAPASFDLIFLVHVLHHLTDPQQFLAAARRALTPNGALAIIGANPVAPDSFWYIYHYFPGVQTEDAARFPPWSQVQTWMAAIGFRRLTAQVVHVVDEVFVGEAVFNDVFLAKNATSQLAKLSEEAYQAGIERIQAAIAANPHLIFRTHLPMMMLTGRK